MGTAKESFIELTERIGRKTGGLSVYPFTSAKRGSEQPVAYLIVRPNRPCTCEQQPRAAATRVLLWAVL